MAGEKANGSGCGLSSMVRPTNNFVTHRQHPKWNHPDRSCTAFQVWDVRDLTKNYNGWNFGGKDQESWTQVLYGKKHSFQNPLHQNYGHTKALAENLDVGLTSTFGCVFGW